RGWRKVSLMSDQQPDRDDRQGSHRPPGPPLRMSRGVLGWVVFILFSLMLVMVVMQNLNKEQVFRYDEFLAHLDDGQIKRVVIREDAIVGELKGPAQSQGQNLNFKVELLPGSNFDRGVLANKLYEKGV